MEEGLGWAFELSLDQRRWPRNTPFIESVAQRPPACNLGGSAALLFGASTTAVPKAPLYAGRKSARRG
jgi:hypothetical protein